MRAVLIPADETEPAREVDVEVRDGLTLDHLQELVGGNIEALPPPWPVPDVTAYVNEDGKYTQPRNPRATELMGLVLFAGDYISGPLVLIGFDARAGDNKPLDAQVAEDLLAAFSRGEPGR